ncbi:phosphate ABC transporter permease PstA [Alicyclobacillus tolerans]|uniref:phosphate ABC transporter permease PstA n=1 Tax=Alicyclobacillus tolerans TaxID=90970 RepID=UPI001F0028FE|nr:phosphate ABC transporter permease PstA [Alicyclobacillus tolerans]MCF8563431.1 phosphate ABC transporter permease PstA [Alicyclobacillus tolerans]
MISTRRKRRKFGAYLGWGFAWLAAAIVVFGLLDMLVTIIGKGVTSFHWNMLWTVTQGVAGGLQNAILGTFELVLIATIFAAPLGILGGIYVSEFAHSKTASVIRFLTEVLSGVPSIVLGYFGYLLMVLQWGWKFSALAGGITLTVMMLPYILRTTESSLLQVSLSQREAAWAIGMTKYQAISKVVWRPAAGGIATGILMAVAIGLGETAPLLYTAGWSSYNPTGQLIGQPVGYLTYVVWTYLDQPYPQARALAYSAAFVLVVIILFIHLVVRTLVWRTSGVRRG